MGDLIIVEAFRRITRFLKGQGTVPAVQLAHAGRKASTDRPWKGGAPVGPDAYGWQAVAPSALAFDAQHLVPDERVRNETAMHVAAVGLITEAEQAGKILANGEADAVLLGRELLRNPSWARLTARELGDEVRVPEQYHRSV